MIRALLAVLRALTAVWLIELAGAGLVIAGVAIAWGLAAALGAGGGFLLLKAFELDMRGSP